MFCRFSNAWKRPLFHLAPVSLAFLPSNISILRLESIYFSPHVLSASPYLKAQRYRFGSLYARNTTYATGPINGLVGPIGYEIKKVE